MKLTVLLDNNTLIDEYFIGEPGLSFFITDRGSSILFDVGYSSAFIDNAKAMGIDLLGLDYVILSHGHLDHTWGLKHLIDFLRRNKKHGKRPLLVCHPDLFCKKSSTRMGNIGIDLTIGEAKSCFDVVLTSEPYWLTKDLVFLGQIPRKFDFERGKAIGKIVKSERSKRDHIYDDSSLVYSSDNKIVVITGCAHSGICNTIEYAKQVCEVHKVKDVIGGLHLLSPSRKRLDETVKYLRSLNLQKMHPCHCTDFCSKCSLSKIAKIEEIGVGFTIKY